MTTPYSLFVPNKLSIPSVSVDVENQPQLHKFLTDYFYNSHDGKQQFKPYAYAGLMLQEVDGEAFDNACLPTDVDEEPSFDSIQDWLKTIIDNFGDHTILICSHYC